MAALEPVMICLNPFEVREVLQEEMALMLKCLESLNPFEVREVLQDQRMFAN